MDERSPLGQWVTSIRAQNVITEVGGWRKQLVISLFSLIFLPKKTKKFSTTESFKHVELHLRVSDGIYQ